jgi:hypothetical protein
MHYPKIRLEKLRRTTKNLNIFCVLPSIEPTISRTRYCLTQFVHSCIIILLITVLSYRVVCVCMYTYYVFGFNINMTNKL